MRNIWKDKVVSVSIMLRFVTFMIDIGTQGRLCTVANLSEIAANIMLGQYVEVKQFVHKNEDNDIQLFYTVEIKR